MKQPELAAARAEYEAARAIYTNQNAEQLTADVAALTVILEE